VAELEETITAPAVALALASAKAKSPPLLTPLIDGPTGIEEFRFVSVPTVPLPTGAAEKAGVVGINTKLVDITEAIRNLWIVSLLLFIKVFLNFAKMIVLKLLCIALAPLSVLD
jgi:hypothetical protein